MLVVNKETLAVLRRLGLNQYESKTYLALINTEASTATELSDSANIPRPRVYDVLAKLEKKGFVVTKPGRPTRYAAVAAKTAVLSLVKARESAHRREVVELEELEERLTKYISTDTVEQGGKEDVYVIKDRRNIYATMGELIESAKSHIIISSHAEGLQRKREEHGPSLHKAKNRGVEVRLIEGQKRIAVIDEHSLVFLADAQHPKNDRVAWIKSQYVADSFKKTI